MKNLAFVFIVLFQFGLVSQSEAAISLVNKTFTTNSNVNFTATEPALTAQNDIIFMWFLVSGDPNITGPTGGWTQVYAGRGSGSIGSYLYWIRRGASAPGYTVSWVGGNYYEVSVSSWRGAATSGNLWDDLKSNPATDRNPSNPDCPSVTTTTANAWVIAFGVGWTGWTTTATPPTGYTIVEGGTNGNNNDIGVAYKIKAAAGAEDPGAFSGQAAGTSNDVGEVTVALKPAGAAAAAPIRHRVIQN